LGSSSSPDLPVLIFLSRSSSLGNQVLNGGRQKRTSPGFAKRNYATPSAAATYQKTTNQSVLDPGAIRAYPFLTLCRPREIAGLASSPRHQAWRESTLLG
jgi:hypothetical protein